MLTISKIKMKFVVIKSKLFTLSTRKKEAITKLLKNWLLTLCLKKIFLLF